MSVPAQGATEREDVRRRLTRPVWREGDDGLYSQSWFAVCLSSEVNAGQVIGKPFLGGKVVVYRGEDGRTQVLSAYCPHVGADLSVGTVVGNELQCAFHKWQFARDGYASRTGIGDAPPRGACLFRFPTVERWGVVFAFNGSESLWQLPDLTYPDDELYVIAQAAFEVPVDPWVVCANTPDVHHFKLVHQLVPDRYHDVVDFEAIEWTDHSFRFQFTGKHWHDIPLEFDVGIYGTSFFFQQGTWDGEWFSLLAPMALPKAGHCLPYFVIATHKGDGSPERLRAAEAFAKRALDMEVEFVMQDAEILRTLHFKPGRLTRSDRFLSEWLERLRAYPRAHPSAEFID